LIENGANIHAHDDFTLRWASKMNHMEVVDYLTESINQSR